MRSLFPSHAPLLSLVVLAAFASGCGLSKAPFDATLPSYADRTDPVETVIHISVDGLRSDAVIEFIDALPTFARLRAQGAFTDNARTTPNFGNTLPNHTSQITGRVVSGGRGHGWDTNRDPDPTVTLHSNRGSYVASVFGVASDAGLRTGLYASKVKFFLFDRSYGPDHGAPDTTGADDGRDKIDTYIYDANTNDLVDQLLADLETTPGGYHFLHIRDPDTVGHRFGWRLWGWHPYMRAVRKADRLIGRVLAAVDADPDLSRGTVVIVTSDHGGSGHDHGAPNPADYDDPRDYTIPFYVWGSGVAAADLYALNEGVREDPGGAHPGVTQQPQPIRNGDAANLSLSLLGLDSIPGSTIGARAPLRVRPAPIDSLLTSPVPR
ncbi:MAG: alkaline phosphatase family protein [Bacteroidota bacterium]